MSDQTNPGADEAPNEVAADDVRRPDVLEEPDERIVTVDHQDEEPTRQQQPELLEPERIVGPPIEG